jgi:HAD superfamily hydrolase (TIGR01509 family)
MKINTAIFDMDGLLVDSEPLWHEAAIEIIQRYDISMTSEEYATSIGLRTKEFLAFWFRHFKIDMKYVEETEKAITDLVIQKISDRADALPGVEYILDFFQDHHFKIGLATSSPFSLIDVVIDKFNIRKYFSILTSAEQLPYGKPHPQVFLDCAQALQSDPAACICFEDSFNGMIAAKAARMKCVVIPAPHVHHEGRWDAADIKLKSLEEFNETKLRSII